LLEEISSLIHENSFCNILGGIDQEPKENWRSHFGIDDVERRMGEIACGAIVGMRVTTTSDGLESGSVAVWLVEAPSG
jgi:hypothetical protein